MTRYPNIAVGAVATSAPVLAQADFMAYHEVVRDSLSTAKQGEECVRVIQNATLQIQSRIGSASGRASLMEAFSVCPSADLNEPLDAANFMATLAGNLDGVVQYNKDNRAFEGAGHPPTIDDVCGILTSKDGMDADAGDAVSRYAALNQYMLNATGQACTDVCYSDMIAEMRNISLSGPAGGGGRQWVSNRRRHPCVCAVSPLAVGARDTCRPAHS